GLEAQALRRGAAARRAELGREPPPEVLQTALSDLYVQYSLRVRLREPHRRRVVHSALNSSIQDVFNENGVQIMSPHYVNDPAAPVTVPKARWFEPPAARTL